LYGSLRAVKVVQTAASTLTVLATPGRASKASRWSNVTPERNALTVSSNGKTQRVGRIRLTPLPKDGSHLSRKLFAGANKLTAPFVAKSLHRRQPSNRGEMQHARFCQWLSNGQRDGNRISSICFRAMAETLMSTLTQYGLMAEQHWREHRPRMVAEMERTGTLQQMLLEAEEQTKDEMDTIRRRLIQQGLTPQQAHDRAWEMVREKYVLLPPESD
jgi:hypothetical protein